MRKKCKSNRFLIYGKFNSGGEILALVILKSKLVVHVLHLGCIRLDEGSSVDLQLVLLCLVFRMNGLEVVISNYQRV